MHCNDFGMAAADVWSRCMERLELPNHHPMQIMPDHMHAIVELCHPVGATLAVARDGSAFARNDRNELAVARDARNELAAAVNASFFESEA